jgi:hypothetical protein
MTDRGIPWEVRASFFASLTKEAGLGKVVRDNPRKAFAAVAGVPATLSTYASLRAAKKKGSTEPKGEEGAKKGKLKTLKAWAKNNPGLSSLLVGAGIGGAGALKMHRYIGKHASATDIALFEKTAGLPYGTLSQYEKETGISPIDIFLDMEKRAELFEKLSAALKVKVPGVKKPSAKLNTKVKTPTFKNMAKTEAAPPKLMPNKELPAPVVRMPGEKRPA